MKDKKSKKISIKDIKNKLLVWEDFYGQDLIDTSGIKKARSKRSLANILLEHRNFLDDQHIDALSDLDSFLKELNLNFY